MPFSVWDYLRARTRDAVLAGINDAVDIVEQGETSDTQHQAATQLRARLARVEARGLPEPIQNGNGRHQEPEPQSLAVEAPVRPSEPVQFDDELERRIDAAAPQRAEEKPRTVAPPDQFTTRKRGRPPKSKQDTNG